MYGRNPKRKPLGGDGSSLEVQELFPTIQGEGPLAGHPAVFIRLGGCNLACAFCDTEFESYRPWALADMLERCRELKGSERGMLAVITGGEPLRQPISPLCDGLLAEGWRVQIETNGTLWRALDERVEIVCSPKAPAGRYFPLHPEIAARVGAVKCLISADEGPYHAPPLPEALGVAPGVPFYLQPIDAANAQASARNTARAVALVQRYGYRLSLQLHKFIGIA